MTLSRLYQVILVSSFLCAIPHFAAAQEVSALQTALSLAKQDLDKAKENHETNTLAVSLQQKIVVEKKKQLEDESKILEKITKEAKLAHQLYLDAQKKYAKAQANLEAAWSNK